jgi:hypothetical protein
LTLRHDCEVLTGDAEELDSSLPLELSEAETLDSSLPVELSVEVLEELADSLPVVAPEDFSPVEPPLVVLLATVAAALRRLAATRAGSCPEASCT